MTSAEERFTVDLEQLSAIADGALPALTVLFEQEAGRHDSCDGLGESGGYSSNANSSFWDITGVLRDRNRRAVEVLTATTEALRDVAALYRRADGGG